MTTSKKVVKKGKKKKRLRLKTSFKRFLIYFAFFLIVFIYALKEVNVIIADFKYKESYEYKILQVGYTQEEATLFTQKLNEEKLNYILEQKYNEHFYPIVKEKYYIDKYFSKYIEYKTYHDEIDYQTVIAIVNVHANLGWYNETKESNVNEDYLMLVNKFYHLDKNYTRDDIINANLAYSYYGNSAVEVVLDNFELMRADVEEELNVHLMINSSFRSYEDQEEIYNSYKLISLQYADSLAARPGHSEHQTGLAIDITSLENPRVASFEKSQEYEWLKENCHQYGFILRYPEGKENITGYSNESWHFRYVGKEVAKIIHDEGITFDEYYAYYIENQQ